MSNKKTVAIINTSEELMEVLSYALKEEGFEVASFYTTSLKRGEINLKEYLRKHKPDVVLYDIAIPYEENWKFFHKLKQYSNFNSARVILTTTNKHVLESLVGPTDAMEIVGKPFDLNALIKMIKNEGKKLKRTDNMMTLF